VTSFKTARVLCCLLLGAANAQAEWYKAEHAIMGTEVGVEIWHENLNHAQVCANQVFSEMRRIDALMSPYKPDSELSKINALAVDQAVHISEELYDLISKSLTYSELSSGAFDITFSSVGYLYDYRNKKHPTDAAIAKLLPAINYRHILLDDKAHTIRFSMKGVRIDLGGIAKGYAIDNAVAMLRSCGITSGYLKAGGDSFVIGDRSGKPWMLGIKHPRQEHNVVLRLPLSNVAISTSGDYERYFIENGNRIHHIISPRTGLSVTDNWSVTVIGDNALRTDALSTALFVMDLKSAMQLVEKLKDVDAVIIDAKGEMHYSAGLVEPVDVRH
jgi:FAD:protein FMN transferase